MLSACAGTAPREVTAVDDARVSAHIAGADSDLERDRRAILAMTGEYEVTFAFEETAVLRPGYARAARQDSAGFETVLVVRQSDRHIVLQHLLVSADGEHVTKHWRQDWTYQAPSRFEFTEQLTWRVVPLADEYSAGNWTQCVYEVNDAPRYCGTGRWNHRYGVSTWTSDRSWRPLPRREYTTRSDYNALNVENRHTITPSGWTHEQDNTKTLREGDGTQYTLVREFGFNDYRRIEGFDFGPAYRYWEATRDYWARVRRQWDRHFADDRGVRLKTGIDGMALIVPLFELAEVAAKGLSVPDTRIAAAFDQWVEAPPSSQQTNAAAETGAAQVEPTGNLSAKPEPEPLAHSATPAY